MYIGAILYIVHYCESQSACDLCRLNARAPIHRSSRLNAHARTDTPTIRQIMNGAWLLN